ncbi:hypothetical protein HAX54_030203 [Datura stramonium]|uniref:Uncharacterized protein n=1 Tax=Datura stramonium TaxID=4076 RepID=A0ABS8V9N9_DATST|nr:hypothetical protein [Datura stramonium]
MVQGSAKQYEGILHCVNTIDDRASKANSLPLLRNSGHSNWIGIGGSIFLVFLKRTKKLVAAKHPVD